jgi:hypothetical protein
MIRAASPTDPLLRFLLESHPFVETEHGTTGEAALSFVRGDWNRSVWQGRSLGLAGLVELTDNNPLVCADEFSVPSPLATLSLIALGPLLRAGLAEGDIVLQGAGLDYSEDLLPSLEQEGLLHPITLSLDEEGFEGVAVLNAFVPVPRLDDWRMLDELYEEAFGRSFYVRSCGDAPWDVTLVHGRPWASYDLRLTTGDDSGLLTIRSMADHGGKLGACQVLHAFNVMCGFEECLGIPETLPARG